LAPVVAVIAIAAETTTSGIGTALAHGGPMALPSGTYAPRDPAASVLYQVVRDHYQTFLAEASQLRDGDGCGSSRSWFQWRGGHEAKRGSCSLNALPVCHWLGRL